MYTQRKHVTMSKSVMIDVIMCHNSSQCSWDMLQIHRNLDQDKTITDFFFNY